MTIQCKVAPSLGALEGHPNDVWGTVDYTNQDDPTVFFGLYGLPDFYTLWRHRGKKWILWAGSDIRHFADGYWLDDEGKIKVAPWPLADWIGENCESWVENEVERDALLTFGIKSQVCPSFMGNIDDYEVSYQPNGKYYASVSGDNFKLYGWDKIDQLASKHPKLSFHLYGNTLHWPVKHKNIHVHGRVPKEQMNEEIKQMQGGLRLVEFDGFSEVLAKSVLWGQWPVSLIKYPYIGEKVLRHAPLFPNTDGRDYYRKTLNQFPWNVKAH